MRWLKYVHLGIRWNNYWFVFTPEIKSGQILTLKPGHLLGRLRLHVPPCPCSSASIVCRAFLCWRTFRGTVGEKRMKDEQYSSNSSEVNIRRSSRGFLGRHSVENRVKKGAERKNNFRWTWTSAYIGSEIVNHSDLVTNSKRTLTKLAIATHLSIKIYG